LKDGRFLGYSSLDIPSARLVLMENGSVRLVADGLGRPGQNLKPDDNFDCVPGSRQAAGDKLKTRSKLKLSAPSGEFVGSLTAEWRLWKRKTSTNAPGLAGKKARVDKRIKTAVPCRKGPPFV
jgi:hypothetical protein